MAAQGMNRYLKPVRQEIPPPGGFRAVRWARNIPAKGFSGAAVFGAVILLSGWGMIGRFKENKMMSVTNKRRAEERGEQWKIIQKHFPFEDPNFRTKYFADMLYKEVELREKHPFLANGPERRMFTGPIMDAMKPNGMSDQGGWYYQRDFIGQEPKNTMEKAAHDAYDELLRLAKKRLALREAHKDRLNARDGLTPREKKRKEREAYWRERESYYRDWWQDN